MARATPHSQRVCCAAAAGSPVGKTLVTRAAPQKCGGVPSAARSMASCRSSTTLPDASGAPRISDQGNAMPAPVSRHGTPSRCSPSGRTTLRTRKSSSASRRVGGAPSGACMTYAACAGRSAAHARKASMAPGSTRQSASTMTTMSGSFDAR